MTLEELLSRWTPMHRLIVEHSRHGFTAILDMHKRRPNRDVDDWQVVTEGHGPTIDAAIADLREAIAEEIATNGEWWR